MSASFDCVTTSYTQPRIKRNHTMEYITQRKGDSPRTRCDKNDETPNIWYKKKKGTKPMDVTTKK